MVRILSIVFLFLLVSSCEDNDDRPKIFTVQNIGTCSMRIGDNVGLIASNIAYDYAWINANQTRTFEVPEGIIPRNVILYYVECSGWRRLVWEDNYNLKIYSDYYKP